MTLLLLAFQVTAAMPLLERGEFADAKPLLTKACAAGEANGCYLLGRTLLAMDQYDAALRILDSLRSTDPARWRVEDAMATAYEALRRPADAEKLYRSAVAGNRDRTPEPRYHLGRFLIREGRPVEAEGALRPVAAKFPQFEPLRFELGRALYQLKQWDAAYKELSAAPNLDEAKRLLALVQQRQQR